MMEVTLHLIPRKYLECLNEPDKSRIWKPVIELASPEEIAMIGERMKDYDADPGSFTPLSAIK